VQHLTQHGEPDPVPQEPRDLFSELDRPQLDVLAEACGGQRRGFTGSFSGDNFDENDSLRLDRMHDDGAFGMRHVCAEPGHRKVGRRTPQQRIDPNRRLDFPIAGRLHRSILDDCLHHCGAGRQGSIKGGVRGDPIEHRVDS
jgi:hypothetical protein